MNCDEALELLSSHLDGANTSEEEAQLQAHLDACPSCRAILHAYETIDTAVATLTVEPPEELRSRVMDAVHSADASPSRKRRFAFGRGTAVAAVVAVILLAAGAGYLPMLSNQTNQLSTVSSTVTYDMTPEEPVEDSSTSVQPEEDDALLSRSAPPDVEAEEAPVTAADVPAPTSADEQPAQFAEPVQQEVPTEAPASDAAPETPETNTVAPSVMTADIPDTVSASTTVASEAFPNGEGMPELLVELTDDPAWPAASNLASLSGLTATATATERAVLFETDTLTVRLILTEAQEAVSAGSAAYVITEPSELQTAADADPCGLLLITP